MANLYTLYAYLAIYDKYLLYITKLAMLCTRKPQLFQEESWQILN